MNENEKLIAEARAIAPGVALSALDLIPDGEQQHGCIISDGAATKEGIVSGFRLLYRLADALEAAEKAHTPTDGEREALANLRAAVDGPHPANSGLDSFTLAHVSHALDIHEARRSEIPEPTQLSASLSPATDPHESDDARNAEEDHRGDWEPEVAVRGTGEHQDSAEGDRDDRDCETDPPEHRLQAAYPHRSTLADARTGVERVDLGAEPQGEPSDAQVLAAVNAHRRNRTLGDSTEHTSMRAALRAAGGVK